MQRPHKEYERFKICKKCGSDNTTQTGTSDDEHHIWFYGWCYNCDHGFVYDMRITTVEDRKGRL